jgi:hypothetical protein
MKRLIALSLTLLVLSLPAAGQEGFPLVGNWIGYWGPTPEHQNRILVSIGWDGETISGTINPGTDDLRFRAAELDTNDWSVRIEVDATDFRGNPLSYVIEGQLENLGSPHRAIAGTWRHQNGSGTFRIELQ